MLAQQQRKGHPVAQVNFYNQEPPAVAIAGDLQNEELAVFIATPTGGNNLDTQVGALNLSFGFNTHHENTIPPWNGPDYHVMVRTDFDYTEKREILRSLAVQWINANCPNQFKQI